jgi:hypothetical protein
MDSLEAKQVIEDFLRSTNNFPQLQKLQSTGEQLIYEQNMKKILTDEMVPRKIVNPKWRA